MQLLVLKELAFGKRCCKHTNETRYKYFEKPQKCERWSNGVLVIRCSCVKWLENEFRMDIWARIAQRLLCCLRRNYWAIRDISRFLNYQLTSVTASAMVVNKNTNSPSLSLSLMFYLFVVAPLARTIATENTSLCGHTCVWTSTLGSKASVGFSSGFFLQMSSPQ